MKEKNDHGSKFSNLSNWKEEAWKNQGFNGISFFPIAFSGFFFPIAYGGSLEYLLIIRAIKHTLQKEI